jgi:glycosyltransferase involved in cell wall biosynthesis
MYRQKLPISVFIIAKNEADRISYSIKSVREWVDEVIVIDSGSTDNTVEIAENLGAKVIFHEWKGYELQKLFGEHQCNNDWILNIDADEEISDELAKEIQQLFMMGEPEIKIYRLRITIKHRFDNKIRPFAPANNPIRLYHKQYASFLKEQNGICHDSVIPKFPQEEITLKGKAWHRSMTSITQTVAKANFLTDMQARDLIQKEKHIGTIHILVEFPLAFIKAYFFRRYFIYGLAGFIDSVVFAFTRFLRVAKAWESRQINKLE